MRNSYSNLTKSSFPMAKTFYRCCSYLVIPFLLLLFAKSNETAYLHEEHASLAPLYFVRVLLILFGVWLSFSLQRLLINLTKIQKLLVTEQEWYFRGLFLGFLMWYGFWLFAYYPGSYTTDTTDTIRQISSLEINDWFSYLHPLIYLFLYQIYPHIIVVGIAQVLLCSFVFAEITSYLFSKLPLAPKIKIPLLLIFSVCLASISSIIYYNFFYMRDIPFALLHLYYAFYLFKVCIENHSRKITYQEISIIMGLGLVLSIYRGEGFIILFSALVTLFLFKKFNAKSFGKWILISLLAFIFMNSYLPKIIHVLPSNKNFYNLTLVAYPLGFITREAKNYISSNYEEDKAILSKVVDLSKLQAHTNPYDIGAFQYSNSDWNKDASESDWQNFYRRTYQIFLENPHLFLAARTANFVALLTSFKGRGERVNDDGRYGLKNEECESSSCTGGCRKFCEEFIYRIYKMMPSCTENGGVCGQFNLMKLNSMSFDWHWNSTFAFLSSITVIFLYKYLPFSAAASAVILSRILLVFLTAPYLFFRYVYSLYLFGLFLPLFILVEVLLLSKAFNKSYEKT